jgi:hypothetical protein
LMAKAYFIRGFKPTDVKVFGGGRTINEITMEYNPASKVWQVPVVCLVNDLPVLRKDWDMAVKDTDVINFVELPRGGGKSNPLQLLLTIVISIVAWYAAGWVTTALNLVGVGQGATLLGRLVYGLTAGLVMAAGGALMGMLFKGPALPSGHMNAALAESASPTYGLNASNNQARLYQPIGEGFGRVKVIPDRVAQTYVKYSDNEYYLYQVFGLGRGSYRIESMSYGDNVFWRDGELVSGYEIEHEYYEAGDPVTLFPDNVETSSEVSGQQLHAPNNEEFNGPLGPFSCNPPGTVTSHVVCNVVFPQGLGRYSDSGALGAITVSVRIELRLISDSGEPISDWVPYVEKSWYMGTLTPQRFSVEIFPAEGRWEARMVRTNNVSQDGRTMQACQWDGMYCYIPGTLTYNQATLAVRTKATNILSQSAASTFGVVYTRILPEYDVTTKTWSEPRVTRKFASALSAALKAPWGGGLTDDRIDLDTLWGVIDPILGEKDWTFDGYFDGAYSVWSIALEMSHGFRVVPRLTHGGVSFVYDRPNRPIRHIFTPRDIIRNSVSIVYSTFTEDTPDNILWNYIDEDAGYQQREVRCALPDTETETPVIKSFIGVVKRKQAFEMGVYQVACNRHRRIQVKFSVEAIGRLLFMGDVCAVNHPYFSNLTTGAIKGFDANGLTIDLGDEIPGLDPAAKYYLALNKPDGMPWGPCEVDKIEGRVATLNAQDLETLYGQGEANPFAFMDPGERLGLPTTWVLQESRDFEGRVIIQSVTHGQGNVFEITAINDSGEVENYGDLPVPPWHYRGLEGEEAITELEAPTDFEPKIAGEKTAPVLELFWKPVAGAAYFDFDISIGATGEYELVEKLRVNYCKVALPPGRTSIRVRAISASGVIGPYAYYEIDTQEFFGDPVDVEVVSFVGGDLKISWSKPDAGYNWSVFGYVVDIMDPDTLAIRRTHTISRYAAAGDQDERTYEYTKEMAMADGGVLRKLLVGVRYNSHGFSGATNSQQSLVTAYDAPPEITGDLSVTIGQTELTLNGVDVNGEYTGFVIARGSEADFDVSSLVEIRITNSLPYVYSGLTPDTEYYFRIAAKDAIADLRAYYMDLNFSQSMTIKTLAIDGGDGGNGG